LRSKVLPAFVEAAERAAAGEANPWPNSMRVKKIEGAEGVWEMTWSSSDPDGRATWEWVTIDGEAAIRWRRVGTHDILRNP
jgi:hypothetical protein